MIQHGREARRALPGPYEAQRPLLANPLRLVGKRITNPQVVSGGAFFDLTQHHKEADQPLDTRTRRRKEARLVKDSLSL